MSNILLFLLVLSLLITLAYWFVFWMAFNKAAFKRSNVTYILPPVSVIIVYKNAENHIKKTIDAILHQNYPFFEVIAIDDFSNDHSLSIAKTIQDPRLILLQADQDLPGKKAALSQAIRYAKNEVLLFTDADCLPASKDWIASMSHKLVSNPSTEIVLGYGPMTKTKGWLNIFIRYETILTAMQYFSYAVFGLPYMGVGRNLMYKKSSFHRIGGFTSHQHIASGDDDLLISKAATPENTAINLDKASFVYSAAKDNLTSFLNQKARHISTSHFYKVKHKTLLSLFALSQILFYVILCAGYTLGYFGFFILLALLLVKWVCQMILQNKYYEHLIGRDIMKFFPLLDIGMVIYYMILPIFGMIKKTEW